jgi:general secretion pathway protein E
VDIGVEPFLISSSVNAVIAQRLVRMLCEDCKESYLPDSSVKALGLKPESVQNHKFFRAKGCDNCRHTGYQGRIGIYEIMPLGYRLKNLIQKTYDSFLIKEEAMKLGLTTLRRDGIDKVLRGLTTIEEVLRVTQK